MSTKPCLGHPGHTCGNTVPRGRSRCPACTTANDRATRPSSNARGYNAQYRRDRKAVLGGPCTLRLPGCTGVADTAHHPDGVGTSTALAGACGHCNSADGAARSRAAR